MFAKSKFRPKPDKLLLRPNDDPPMHTVHLDFAELTKQSGQGTRTKAFLVAIDRNTRFASARAGRENATAVIAFLNQRLFSNTKVIISDRAKLFSSKELREWAAGKGVTLISGSP